MSCVSHHKLRFQAVNTQTHAQSRTANTLTLMMRKRKFSCLHPCCCSPVHDVNYICEWIAVDEEERPRYSTCIYIPDPTLVSLDFIFFFLPPWRHKQVQKSHQGLKDVKVLLCLTERVQLLCTTLELNKYAVHTSRPLSPALSSLGFSTVRVITFVGLCTDSTIRARKMGKDQTF